jgi:hypothetical protein
MWLNHFDREERMKDQRNKKIENKQNLIFSHPERFGNQYNNVTDYRKDHLINSSMKNDNNGTSLITELSGCPVQKVHKLKQKRREKLSKYLCHGSKNMDHELNKFKLQNGNSASLIMTPDYHFNKVLDPKKDSYVEDIIAQIKNNQYKRDFDNKLQKERDQFENNCCRIKMDKYDKKLSKQKLNQKKKFLTDLTAQIKQKQMYGGHIKA